LYTTATQRTNMSMQQCGPSNETKHVIRHAENETLLQDVHISKSPERIPSGQIITSKTTKQQDDGISKLTFQPPIFAPILPKPFDDIPYEKRKHEKVTCMFTNDQSIFIRHLCWYARDYSIWVRILKRALRTIAYIGNKQHTYDETNVNVYFQDISCYCLRFITSSDQFLDHHAAFIWKTCCVVCPWYMFFLFKHNLFVARILNHRPIINALFANK
jgi:hypothetical protein